MSSNGKSVVAIAKGGRWDAKRLVAKCLEGVGGIESIAKRGDTVLLKPNMGYPEAPGMPSWTCLTDFMVLEALTELFKDHGAKKVITAEAPAHGISGNYMFEASGIGAAVKKAGGEVHAIDEGDFVLRKIPDGIVIREQWVPKIMLEVDAIVNVPKIKPTRVGKFTLGYKNFFGLVPEDERVPWHRIPEHFYFLVDLYKLLRPTVTVMDGLVIQEGLGPRFGSPVEWGVIIAGKDPVATESIAMMAMGHEPYEQMVLPIAAKAGQGTMDPNQIEVVGETLEAVTRYCKVSPGDLWLNASPNVQEYCGGACWGCGLWIQYTPYPWEVDPGKKYALVVGNTPKIPDSFKEDEVIVLGNCAARSKKQIEEACGKTGIKPQFIAGCPPYGAVRPGYLKSHNIHELPYTHHVKRVHDE
jgi:uncharacterized protein (DUF362 family)